MTDRRRSIAVGVGAAALGLVALAAFDSGTDQRGVCVDRTTDVRVDDEVCEDGNGGGGVHGWYFIPSGRRAPAEGQAISGQGSFTQPRSQSFSKGGVSADGGKVTRGGFISGHGSFGG